MSKKYIVNISAWVTIEAPDAQTAWGIMDSALDRELLDTLESVGDDANVTIDEPELYEEVD